MEYRKLPEPSLFLEAALANFDEADWIIWQKGICVRRENSLLAIISNEEGSICYFTDIKDVFSVEGKLFIVSSEGVFAWDGEKEPEKQDIPLLPHLQIDQAGFCGWKDFRYQVWMGEEEFLLPQDCTKPRFFPFQESLFWSYWLLLQGFPLLRVGGLPCACWRCVDFPSNGVLQGSNRVLWDARCDLHQVRAFSFLTDALCVKFKAMHITSAFYQLGYRCQI